jgi:hypothetical protein
MKELTIKAPEGFEFIDDRAWDRRVEAVDGRLEVAYRIRRTAPDMVAALLPRDVAEDAETALRKHVTCAPSQSDRDAIYNTNMLYAADAIRKAREARTAVTIAGPAGCAEVSVEDAQHAAVIVRASINSAEHRVASALRKAAGGS